MGPSEVAAARAVAQTDGFGGRVLVELGVRVSSVSGRGKGGGVWGGGGGVAVQGWGGQDLLPELRESVRPVEGFGKKKVI